MSLTALPKALFISHGGGPMPLLGDAAHLQLVACLEELSAEMGRPSAIVLVSAHWEEPIPTIIASEKPALYYDYSGFPPESYQISYPCQGEPQLAEKISRLLTVSGIQSNLTLTRGYDHGVFVPLKIMYPNADIPCVQLSLANSLDPAIHIAMGRALQGLTEENVLVLGSGSSFHNMQQFFVAPSDKAENLNHDFERWLIETCGDSCSENERQTRLVNWENAPGARFCHPREEHLLPLHVCYGVAEAPCTKSIELEILNKKVTMHLW